MVRAFFDHYVSRRLRRHFHRVWLRTDPQSVDLPGDRACLIVTTHCSWWDVLVGYWVARRLLRIDSYAPMDEAQLRRYRVLARLGVYSVDRHSRVGLRTFLEYTTGLLRPGRAVWVTPQGAIVSSRRRPLSFQTGVGHLARRAAPLIAVPVAIVYEFLDEPRPEIFMRIGAPRRIDAAAESAAALARHLEHDLTAELDGLLAAVDARALDGFRCVLEGRTGVSRVYDPVRRLRAWRTGHPDPRRHGDVISDPRRRRA